MAGPVLSAEAKGQTVGWPGRLRSIGPGIVFVLSSTGSRDLLSNSIAGATTGTAMVWVLVLAVAVRGFILDASARYVLYTGNTLLGGIGDKGRIPVWLWFAATLFRRHAQSLVRLMLLGTAANFILPLPFSHSIAILGTVSWVAGFVVLYWGRYEGVERMSRVLAVVLGSTLVAAAVLSRPAPALLVSGVLHPSLPSRAGSFSPVLVLMAIVSSAVGGFGNLNYSAYLHEKGWRSLGALRMQRWDLAASLAGMLAMHVLIQVAAAGALRPRGLQVDKVEDLVPMFATVIGQSGEVLLGALLWGVVFSSHVTGTAAGAIMLTDVWYRFIRPSGTAVGKTSERPFYRWIVLYLCLSPLYVFATDWTPVGLVLAYGVISILALPVISGMILWLTSDRAIMGDQVNGWLTNAVLSFAVITALYLGWEGLASLGGGARRG